MNDFPIPDLGGKRCPLCDHVERRVNEWGLLPAVVLDDALSLAYVQPFRMAPGRTLVIPKRHVPTVFELTDAEGAAMMRTVRRVSLAVARAFRPTGITFYQNNGTGAHQEFPHVHFHIIPRYDGNDEFWQQRGPEIPFAEMESVAEQIKQRL